MKVTKYRELPVRVRDPAMQLRRPSSRRNSGFWLLVCACALFTAVTVATSNGGQATAPKPATPQTTKPATPQTTVVATPQAPATPQAGYVGTEAVRDLPHRLRHVDQRVEARPGKASGHTRGRAGMRNVPRSGRGARERSGEDQAETARQDFSQGSQRHLHDVPQQGRARAVERQPARSAQRLVHQLPQHPQAEVDHRRS